MYSKYMYIYMIYITKRKYLNRIKVAFASVMMQYHEIKMCRYETGET